MDEGTELPDRLERRFENWRRSYSVDELELMTVNDLESAQHLFESEVILFRTEFKRGRLVTPALAAIAGAEPYTHRELRIFRRRINEEADAIRANFRVAKGKIRAQQPEKRKQLIAEIRKTIAQFTELVLAGVMFLDRFRFWK